MRIATYYLALPTLCCTAIGNQGLQRRLQPDNGIVSFIEQSHLSEAMSLMVSNEEVSRDNSNAGIEPCSSPSATWLKQQVSNVPEEDINNFFDWHIHSLPFAYKLYVEERGDNHQEYFGLDGQYTDEINSIHELSQDFWSNTGVNDDIELICAHGSDLADRHNKLIPTLQVMFGSSYDDEYTIYDHATDIQDLIARLPGGYNYPLLTFNAFATDAKDKNDRPSSIVIGDGYFEFQESVGLSSEGPEYALTHEHAHHLQFVLNGGSAYEDQEYATPSQKSRREELMADALSAYFLAHEDGGGMTSNEISNIHTIAYSVGDCATSNTGHHGTPRQRKCATRWGASLSQDVEDIDLIELQDRFDSWYESVDYLDDLCQHVASSASLVTSSLVYILPVMSFLFGSMFGF